MTKEEFIAGEQDSGIVIGDLVLVKRKCRDHENGWSATWNDSAMTPCIGTEMRVIDHRPGTTTGFQLETKFWFPFFVLEKVNSISKHSREEFVKGVSKILVDIGGE